MELVLFGLLGLGFTIGFFWKRSAFFAYGAAAIWALLGFLAMQRSAGANPTQIVDVYMGLFWLCVAFVVACVLLPNVMREKPEKEDGDVELDGIGDDVSAFMPRRSDKQGRPGLSRTAIARFDKEQGQRK